LEGKETEEEEEDTAENETNRLRRFPVTDDRPVGRKGNRRRRRHGRK
jgi:hypothetical protein